MSLKSDTLNSSEAMACRGYKETKEINNSEAS